MLLKIWLELRVCLFVFFLQFFVRKQIARWGQYNICRTSWRWSSALPNRIGQDQNRAVNVCSRAFFSFSFSQHVSCDMKVHLLTQTALRRHVEVLLYILRTSSTHRKGEDIWLSNSIFRMQESWTGELHLNHLRWIIEFHLFHSRTATSTKCRNVLLLIFRPSSTEEVFIFRDVCESQISSLRVKCESDHASDAQNGTNPASWRNRGRSSGG